jgi:ubiquinone biosynthesis protein COQ9
VTSLDHRQAARDAAIIALLPLVPEQGWSFAALRRAAGEQAALLFQGGPAGLVEAYIDLANRQMAESAAPLLATQRVSQAVRTLIATRLALAAPHRQAVRRAVALLALPGHMGVAARCSLATVNAIWAAAGDRSADFSWYTKRAILASVYTATLLFWLNDAHDMEDSLAFLDRRLAQLAHIGKLRGKLAARRAA